MNPKSENVSGIIKKFGTKKLASAFVKQKNSNIVDLVMFMMVLIAASKYLFNKKCLLFVDFSVF